MSETTNLKLFIHDDPETNMDKFDIEKAVSQNWRNIDDYAETVNEKLKSLEKVDSTTNETITAIQEEQTTQNENIEKNATAIEQNKKDVDEELTKIKKENSLLKAQIPEGHASGNSIHLEDSSNMDFECKLRGGSRQATRSGKNVINVKTTVLSTYSSIGKDDWITIERTNTAETGDAFCNFFTKLTKEVKTDTTYTIICEIKSVTTTSDGYLSITNDSTGFAFGATTPSKPLTKLKAGDIIINKLKTKSDFTDVTNLLRTFVAVNAQSSVKIVFRLSVIEGDVTADSFEYESYGVSPSLDFSSEIKNVGDNINLLNKDIVDASSNLRGNALDTGRRLIANKDGTYTYGVFKLGGRELLGKTLGIHADIETTGGNPGISIFAGNSSSLTKSLLQVALSASGTKYMTIPSNLNSELDTISAVLYVTTDTSVVAGTYVDYTNLKVQVGSEEVVYSAYNCGSLGVTISNKNLYKVEKVINDSNTPRFIFLREGNVEFTTGAIPLIIAPTTIKEKTEYTYILKCKSNVTTENSINFKGIYEDGTSELLSANKKKDTNEFIVKFKTNKEKTLAYVTQQYTNSAGVTIITEGTMILEGDYLNLDEPYKIHQEQEIIFPLAEGQKLYEGSYLAEDGIHNIRTQIKLLSSGGNFFVSDLGTYQVFGKTQKGVKKGSRLLSNYFKDYDSVGAIKYTAGIANNNLADRIYVSNGISTTLDEFKDWLNKCENAGRPVILEYELAEEEIIPYTQEQQAVIDKILYTYKNVTNISVDDELATLDITYKKDIETMFNNQAKEYNERLSNIENLLNTTETSALLLDNLENDLEKEV
nr:MAG TPA: hypothetical protein [Caudoviricetes sp.]